MKFLPTNKKRIAFVYAAAIGLLLLAIIFGVGVGSSFISPVRAIMALVGRGETADVGIVRYIRLPRALAGIFCGGALALSGAVIQSVLGNRLASPSIIGVNSGAGFLVTVGCALGIAGGISLSLLAFLGALISSAVIALGAKKFGSSGGTVILMGVALNSLFGALSDTVITLAPDVSILSNDFRIGGFSAVTYQRLIPAAVIIIITSAALFLLSPRLEVLTLGEESATGLGLRANLVSAVFLCFSALLAGSAVSVCGGISFVGLLVPHALRRIMGGRIRHLLPLCFLVGGGFVSLCDTLARAVFSPYEIPVGIIMAFFGAPLFIVILIKRKRGRAL